MTSSTIRRIAVIVMYIIALREGFDLRCRRLIGIGEKLVDSIDVFSNSKVREFQKAVFMMLIKLSPNRCK